MLHSEPHFYDASYKQTDRKDPIPIDGDGRCIINKVFERERNSKRNILKWKCSSECKVLTKSEVTAILNLKAEFEDPMHEVRMALQECDKGCPNMHTNKTVELPHKIGLNRKDHPLICHNDSKCNSKLRIVREASVHFAVLRTFLSALYKARNDHMRVSQIDEALRSRNLHALMVLSGLEIFDALFSNSVDLAFEPESISDHADCTFRKPNLESELLYTNAELIAKLVKKNKQLSQSCML